MKKLITLLALFLLFSLLSPRLNAMSLEDYLPNDARYDNSIPTPAAFTGIDVGLRHYRHDQIVNYLSILAASSPRAKIMDYGVTNEGRRLVLMFISSEQNIKNLDALDKNKDILKVWHGFTVHGNEASGANASVLFAYHLIAGNSQKIEQILNDTLIIIDPAINPDGYDKYITDVNSMRGMIDNHDEHDASHQEATPNGRTNHYWFDLNRDWLLLTQVESQARIKQFQKWKPHVLGDHHEMGSDKTFFFQPGVPDRTNPLISKDNIALTNELGKFHAKALDAKNASYYTKESFDDFYPGKGSTYPDLQGSVGILFEQAKARGGTVKTKEGLRHLDQAIDNQFQTALSTLEGSHALKNQLISYQKDFYQKASEAAKKAAHKGYVLNFENNIQKAKNFVEFLNSHNIEVQALSSDVNIDKKNFPALQSLYVPVQQPQFYLIESLFSTDKTFKDNTFYDVSAWNLPMAWGISYAKSKSHLSTEPVDFNKQEQKPQNKYSSDALAYAFSWNNKNSAAAANYLMRKNIKLKATLKPFTTKVNGQTQSFQPGTILFSHGDNPNADLLQAVAEINEFFHIPSTAISSGLSDTGVDLGSPSVKTLHQPKVLLVIGKNINSYQAGSFWHLFDTQVGLPLTKITQNQLKSLALNDYTHLILPTGNYSSLSESTAEKIKKWTTNGGHLISFQNAAGWVNKHILDSKIETKEKTASAPRSYASFDSDLAKNTVGGAIIAANADLTHPLAYGMTQSTQHVLVKGSHLLAASKNPYSTPLQAKEKALAAGYLSEKMQDKFSSSSLIIADKLGKGSVIRFGFNPNFRGFWQGTQKWLINSIFFTNLIKKTLT